MSSHRRRCRSRRRRGGPGTVAQGVQLAGVVQEELADHAVGAIVKVSARRAGPPTLRVFVCGCQVKATGTNTPIVSPVIASATGRSPEPASSDLRCGSRTCA